MRNLVLTTLSAAALLTLPTLAFADDRGAAAGALGERLRRVSAWRSSAVSGRKGSVWWRDMGHLETRGSPHHFTRAHGN